MNGSQNPMIAVDNLDVTFTNGRSRVAAVSGLSFAVPRGGSFGIVGESGSGKSTVLKAIAGLIEAPPGSVHIDGRAMGAKRMRSDRKLL